MDGVITRIYAWSDSTGMTPIARTPVAAVIVEQRIVASQRRERDEMIRLTDYNDDHDIFIRQSVIVAVAEEAR